jgi:hypothetical protein
MTTAGVLTFLLLFLGSVAIVTLVFALTVLAVAFIEAPDDLHDIDIKGTPKQNDN